MSTPGRAPKRRERLAVPTYIGATVVLAVGVVVLAALVVGPPTDVVALALLCVMGIGSYALREPDIAGSGVQLSLQSIVLLAAIPLVGPVGTAIVCGLSIGIFFRRSRPHALVFNVAMNVFCGAAGGLIYRACGARDLASITGVVGLLLHLALPLLIAAVAQMLLNALLLAGIMRANKRIPVRRAVASLLASSGVAYLGYGIIGFLLVVLWKPAGVGPFSAVLILAPLFVARWAFVQYGAEERSHRSALSALVTAVETKDPFAAGHSQRVATLSDRLGEQLSLTTQELASLRFAALLHDVGKVGLSTRLVRRPGELTAHDLEALAEHPAQGADLVGGLSFLEASRDGIRHHHERWDGRGYPDRLAGDAIPLAARIIAVADAVDALTSPRPTRPALTDAEALAELRARAGVQFDPRVVEALGRALARQPLPARTDVTRDLDGRGDYVDHDEPTYSDLYAGLVADAQRTPPKQTPPYETPSRVGVVATREVR